MINFEKANLKSWIGHYEEFLNNGGAPLIAQLRLNNALTLLNMTNVSMGNVSMGNVSNMTNATNVTEGNVTNATNVTGGNMTNVTGAENVTN